jgi:hypothetical protein
MACGFTTPAEYRKEAIETKFRQEYRARGAGSPAIMAKG